MPAPRLAPPALARAPGCPNLSSMKRIRRLALLSLIAVLFMVAASPAHATEDSTETEVTESTVAPVQISQGEGPAVEVPPVVIEVPEQPWTARFIYPAIVVITILLILALIIGYNHKIRNRYQVVS
jgi:hypothetical protein